MSPCPRLERFIEARLSEGYEIRPRRGRKHQKWSVTTPAGAKFIWVMAKTPSEVMAGRNSIADFRRAERRARG